MKSEPERVPTNGAPPHTVAELLAIYLDHLDPNLSQRHRDDIKFVLAVFAKDLGSVALADLKPLHILSWLKQHPQWKSPWTIQRNVANVTRVFSWADEMDVISRNPLRRLHLELEQGDRRRAMSHDEFRALLRGSRAHFRRLLFFLRWTGCRPCELRNLVWSMVDFDRAVVVLTRQQHKAGKKTKRPRLIPLIGPLVKMLRWMQKRGRVRYWNGLPVEHEPTAKVLVDVLTEAGGSLPVREVTKRMKALGVSPTHRMLWRARQTAGVAIKPVVKPGKGRYMVYELSPRGDKPAATVQTDAAHVFLNDYAQPYSRNGLCTKYRRLRGRLGLARDCSLGCIRHQFATFAIANDLTLALTSALMGHSDPKITAQQYVHVAELAAPLHGAMRKALHGWATKKGGVQ